mmetsp:Transcript_5988/g.14256  ORF Transcript_5988/g.14256 Transcript_5988/m.14256 type:complete len:258 (+) Transcript_5988:616-1389(+)
MGKMSTRMYSLSHKLRSSPSRDACLSQWSCPASNSTTCAGVATQTCAGGASSVWMAKVRCASCNFSLLPSPGEREALRVEALMSPSWPGGLPSPASAPRPVSALRKLPLVDPFRGRTLLTTSCVSAFRFRWQRGRRFPAGPVWKFPNTSELPHKKPWLLGTAALAAAAVDPVDDSQHAELSWKGSLHKLHGTSSGPKRASDLGTTLFASTTRASVQLPLIAFRSSMRSKELGPSRSPTAVAGSAGQAKQSWITSLCS